MSPVLVLLVLAAASGQEGGDLERQLDEALRAAPEAQKPPSNPPPEAPATDDLTGRLDEALKAPPDAKTGASSSAGLLNPDISLVADVAGGVATRAPIAPSGDDPNLGADPRPAGLTLQELELAFQSTVDPYFRAAAFLTIPNLEGVEVEEAYAQTTSLPAGLQLKAGVFRSSAGRQNEQHLHVQDFVRRPLLNAAYLGPDGLRGPGAQLTWLTPLPFFLRLSAEALSLSSEAGATFGGAGRTQPALVTGAETFFSLSESLSLLLGATAAAGRAGLEDEAQGRGPRTLLAGADLMLRWRPPNVSQGYHAVTLQAEYFWRHTRAFEEASRARDAGMYLQLTGQLSRRWNVGARWDVLGLPASERQPRAGRVSGLVAFVPSEFARVRLQVDRERGLGATTWAGLLQLEYAIGAHGAHPY